MALTGIPVDEDGFRQRGQQVTRLETFVDAAFAFSLTLLVIFQSDLPGSMEEVRLALRRIPTFVACFVLIALFWGSHNRWSRRFGLNDTRSTVLSLALVLVVLIYVYPLRMVVSQGLAIMTDRWVPPEIADFGDDWLVDIQTIFIVYSVGFSLLSWLMWQLNRHAGKRADALELDGLERFDLHAEISMHRTMALTGLASVMLSLAVLSIGPSGSKAWLVSLPMWLYAVMGAWLGHHWRRHGRRRSVYLSAGRELEASSRTRPPG